MSRIQIPGKHARRGRVLQEDGKETLQQEFKDDG